MKICLIDKTLKLYRVKVYFNTLIIYIPYSPRPNRPMGNLVLSVSQPNSRSTGFVSRKFTKCKCSPDMGWFMLRDYHQGEAE